MQKFIACFVCILALLAVAMPVIIAEDKQNSTGNNTRNQTQNITQIGSASQHTKVLRAGFENTKPLNDLDVYGNKSTYNISSSGANSAFNASQRLGNTSKITYNTNNTKPTYNVSQYSRTKPTYEVPGTLSSKPVYSISGYPVIKAANSIP